MKPSRRPARLPYRAEAIWERLQLSELRLNQSQAVAKIGSWERDLATDVIWWSDETYRLLDLDPAKHQASLDVLLARIHPEDRPHVASAIEESNKHRRPYALQYRVILPDGTRRILSSLASLLTDADGRPTRVVGTIQDITEQVALEREVIAVGERERERVGRDLHDGLGQTLCGISLSLKALANGLERGHDAPLEMLRQLEGSVQVAMRETSRVARLLSPRISGLRDALERLVKQFDHDGLRCTVRGCTEHDAHDPEVEAQLYRIAQEAVSNAVKHSKAANIELRYNCNGTSIRLEVLDDGVGVPDARDSEGIGFRNMRYRAHMINGILEVDVRASGGTSVGCVCPCRLDEAGHTPTERTPTEREPKAAG